MACPCVNTGRPGQSIFIRGIVRFSLELRFTNLIWRGGAQGSGTWNLTYTDDADDLADDLKIEVQDRDGVWLEKWLTEAVEAAAGGKLSISAVIIPENWERKGKLKTGAFELDGVDASGPPAKVTISATSLAFSANLRQTKKSKAWKNYNLSGIASEIAGSGGMSCVYESSTNPSYDRVEQTKQSDIDFLRKLCQDAGISIKATDGKLVLVLYFPVFSGDGIVLGGVKPWR